MLSTFFSGHIVASSSHLRRMSGDFAAVDNIFILTHLPRRDYMVH
jgi:hypothetical protein